MSKTGGTATQRTETAPAGFQAPFIQEAFERGRELFRAGQPEFFPGALTAPLTEDELEAQDLARNVAGGVAPDLLGGTNLAFNRTLELPENILNSDVARNAADAFVNPIIRNLTEQVLPNIRFGAIEAGQPGGSRQAIAESLATGQAVRESSEALDRFFGGLLDTSIRARNDAISQLPQLLRSQTFPVDVLSGVGAQNRAFDQADIDEAVQRFNFEQNIPFQNLREFANLVTLPLGSTVSATTEAPERGTAEQIAGAASTLLPLIARILRGL